MLKRNQFEINSIAEVGCGAGEILNQLYQRHPNKDIKFYGYEIKSDAFQLCLERSNDRLDFFIDDIFNVNKKFGLLLIMDVIEHVDDYIGFIKQCSDKADYKLYHIPLDFISTWFTKKCSNDSKTEG
ncbi:MAG: class I SAM-dependent methyltransferase [Emticicia sp.]|nr:class I SAM-dependent methyltransferase [Emticicia sp.]